MRSLLSARGFRRYFFARTLSRAGDLMYPIGLTVLMLDDGYGAGEIGLVLGAALAPTILFMLFGGVLADHLRPRPLMVAADLLSFGALTVLTVAFMVTRPSIGLLVGVAVCTGVAAAMFKPGVAALVTDLVPGGSLRQANAMVRVSESMMALVGPALASLVIVLAGATTVIAIDALTFALSAWLLSGIRLTGATRIAGRPKVWRDLAQGWREFSSRTWLWTVISVFLLLGLTVFGPFHVLSAVTLTERLGAPGYGMLMTAHGLGAILGGLYALGRRFEHPLRAGAIALLGFAPMLLSIGLALPVPILAPAMFLGGGGMALWAVMWSTSVQSHSPPHALSRIHAYDAVGSMALIPVGRALAGPVSESAGVTATLAGSATIITTGCLVLLAVPAVRRLRPVEDDVRDENVPVGAVRS